MNVVKRGSNRSQMVNLNYNRIWEHPGSKSKLCICVMIASREQKKQRQVIGDPREGEAKSWKISPLTSTEILQGDVDELSENSDNTIPHCKMSIKWTRTCREDQLWQTEFTRDVNFLGSTAPKGFVIDFHQPTTHNYPFWAWSNDHS